MSDNSSSPRNATTRGFRVGRAIATTVLVVPKSMPIDSRSGVVFTCRTLIPLGSGLVPGIHAESRDKPGHAPFDKAGCLHPLLFKREKRAVGSFSVTPCF